MKYGVRYTVLIVLAAFGFHVGSPASADELDDILRETTGVYTDLPEGVVTISYTKGPILGNGEFGVTIGGTPQSQTLYMNRVDFGARALGGVTILGRRAVNQTIDLIAQQGRRPVCLARKNQDPGQRIFDIDRRITDGVGLFQVPCGGGEVAAGFVQSSDFDP